MFYRKFYSELGKMLYAVAMVDGAISPKEKEELRNLVRTELVPAEGHMDKYGTDAAYYTEIEFDIMEDVAPEPEEALQSFLDYIETHYTAIDKHMRNVSLKAAQRLAEAYRHTNKSESSILKTIKQKLQALPEREPQQSSES